MASKSSFKKLSVVYRDLGSLQPYARNSRTHSDAQVAQIAASITEYGFTNPVLIDEAGGIIAGHGRVLAAAALGMRQVPTITLAGLTEAQRRAYVIADNKMALNAGWDFDVLRGELDGLEELGFDLDLTGFSAEEIAAFDPDVTPGGFPDLRSGDREPYQQVAFVLHDEQAESVRRALGVAKGMGPFDEGVNLNSNGNAIARVCEIFLTQHGNT